jgi:hypothetical protein
MSKIDLSIIDCLNDQVAEDDSHEYEDLCDLISNSEQANITCDGEWCPKCPLYFANSDNLIKTQQKVDLLNLVTPDSSE